MHRGCHVLATFGQQYGKSTAQPVRQVLIRRHLNEHARFPSAECASSCTSESIARADSVGPVRPGSGAGADVCARCSSVLLHRREGQGRTNWPSVSGRVAACHECVAHRGKRFVAGIASSALWSVMLALRETLGTPTGRPRTVCDTRSPLESRTDKAHVSWIRLRHG